jgi:hypothetical protein
VGCFAFGSRCGGYRDLAAASGLNIFYRASFIRLSGLGFALTLLIGHS